MLSIDIEKHAVYALIDPRNHDIRYVGMSKHPYKRYGQHLAMQKDNPSKNTWIQELADEGLVPEIIILEWVEENITMAQEREGYWINYYLNEGCSLFNVNLPKNVDAMIIYHELVDIVFTLRGLTNFQYRILAHVARSADKARRCYCSIDIATLADSTESSERYTRETLRELEGMGLIAGRSKVGGRGNRIIYDITLPRKA